MHRRCIIATHASTRRDERLNASQRRHCTWAMIGCRRCGGVNQPCFMHTQQHARVAKKGLILGTCPEAGGQASPFGDGRRVADNHRAKEAPPACAVTSRRSRSGATSGVSRDGTRLSTRRWFCTHAADSARPRGDNLGSKGIQTGIEHRRRRQFFRGERDRFAQIPRNRFTRRTDLRHPAPILHDRRSA